MRLTILGLLALTMWAADAPKPEPPKITEAQQIAYFQAKADLLEAQSAANAAQNRLDAAVKSMQAVCPLALDKDQRPVCQEPKPVEAAKP